MVGSHLKVRTVQYEFIGGGAGRSNLGEDAPPDTTSLPACVSVVDCFAGPHSGGTFRHRPPRPGSRLSCRPRKITKSHGNTIRNSTNAATKSNDSSVNSKLPMYLHALQITRREVLRNIMIMKRRHDLFSKTCRLININPGTMSLSMELFNPLDNV